MMFGSPSRLAVIDVLATCFGSHFYSVRLNVFFVFVCVIDCVRVFGFGFACIGSSLCDGFVVSWH